MKVSLDTIKGKVVKDNEQYLLEDNSFLKNITLSKTTLHKNQATNGHKHDDLDEIYIFLSGSGGMQIDEEHFDVKENDILLIPGGAFHRVFNHSKTSDLVFLSIFQSYER